MAQVARNVTDTYDGFLRDKRYLINHQGRSNRLLIPSGGVYEPCVPVKRRERLDIEVLLHCSALMPLL